MKLFHEFDTTKPASEAKKSQTLAVRMSLYQLQELASRQQEQIESTHRLIMNKEQRLNYLSSVQDSQQGPIFDYDQNLNMFKEKISLQEAKLRKLRLLKGQIQKQRCSNSNMCSELETMKIVYKEKERELSVALTKIEALTRQLDELKNGNISNSYNMKSYKHPNELEKLRLELLHKSKLCKQNEEELVFKRNVLYKRQADMLKIDQKICELQSRLTRKRQLNQQLSQQLSTKLHVVRSSASSCAAVVDNDDNDLFAPKSFLRNSIGHSMSNTVAQYPRSPIATVEPLQRFKASMIKYDYPHALEFTTTVNKTQDSKYQTLPYNTKFVTRNLNAEFLGNNPNENDGSSSSVSGGGGGGGKLAAANRNHINNMINNNCDNHASAKDISLIISHNKNDTKDNNSLEERPSPSGSSGSSDRISSSMTAYSYVDKLDLNGFRLNNSQRYYANLEKNFRKANSLNNNNKNEQMFTSTFGQNNNTNTTTNNNNNTSSSNGNNTLSAAEKAIQCENTIHETQAKTSSSSNCSSSTTLDLFYKTKPSLPVKPISTLSTESANNNYPIETNLLKFNSRINDDATHHFDKVNNDHFNQSSPVFSQGNSQKNVSSTQTLIEKESPCDSSQLSTTTTTTNLKFDRQKVNGNESSDTGEDQHDNQRNVINEDQRSTVSEIVNKLNNWSLCNGSFDWEKTKRRPVLATNEMEQELSQETDKKFESVSSNQCKQTIIHSDNTNESANLLPPPTSLQHSDIKMMKNKLDQDLVNNNNNNNFTLNGQKEDSLGEENCDQLENSKLKRIKGSLKSQESKRTRMPLVRRVSFDPLALLLDASLEGELELVKKTSVEVPNPSASNDEGITALHNATCAGHSEVVKYLVEIGCDVNAQDSDGWTPLHCAASCNSLAMIKFLVKSGACIFATTFSDHETAAEKCEEDEEGFDGCSQYLYAVQDQLGSANNGLVYALYDYESQNADELSFHVGDAIRVLRKGDDQEKEWWWSKLGSCEGYIPRNLIGLYPRIQPPK